ncbi:hypothetical protein Thena_1658 [Thermodesulfobium narugense DSM 14796]|uniref:Roadblock/LC7 family protein n=1 Tax=Thermodesulfobium narugense DSM 14796 TaxID=747365 RepID=M1E8P0_9BACT|nr:hypothetical protein [Thermodesulfobium narugense]AEE15268.1 hypothetical protein Thena_1658 [Thermodesulfobium narugense DSM 14796]
MDEDLREDKKEIFEKDNNLEEEQKGSKSLKMRSFSIFVIKNSWFNIFEASLIFFLVVISVFFDSFYGSFPFRTSVFIWFVIFYIVYSLIFLIILKITSIYKILTLVILSLILDVILFYFSSLIGVFPYKGFEIEFGPFMIISSVLLPFAIVLIDRSFKEENDVNLTAKEPVSLNNDKSVIDDLDNPLDNQKYNLSNISKVEDFTDIQLPLSISGFSHYADNLVGSCGYILVNKDGVILSERNFFENSEVKALILDSLSKMIKDSLLRLDFGKLQNMLLLDDQIGVMAFLLRDGAKFFVFFDSRLDRSAQFELFNEAFKLSSRLVFDII